MLTITPSKSATFEDLGSESSGEGNGDSETKDATFDLYNNKTVD